MYSNPHFLTGRKNVTASRSGFPLARFVTTFLVMVAYTFSEIRSKGGICDQGCEYGKGKGIPPFIFPGKGMMADMKEGDRLWAVRSQNVGNAMDPQVWQPYFQYRA